ncbi:hypothetical protein [Mangrovihabitans endophyticus]|uniref:Uncharacterized protein n=1 Tax=Mangrovihabitans endophyticus TaxID=1751298 RepID=A0A8J3C293_9ACTN|nr:hypothetical protein [Mangrovihabitans endophyticus]GGK99469.1 hypothetical protein GCM10012284_37380 [Mangrovihabitans endophyticus]
MRPDRRVETQQTRTLRAATRSLRLHLDTLPIDVSVDVSGDRFLAGLAFMFARQRYDCAESMIGAGFGGTVLGSMARSLLVDGLRWLWIGEQPHRRRALLGDLLEERNRICIALEKADASCPILTRWLMPLPAVADLTGQSMSWVDAPPMPSEEQLLDDLFAPTTPGQPAAPTATDLPAQLRIARQLLDMIGVRGAAMILAHAGHGNHLGMLSSLTDDGVAGHDLRADHEALFMQVAAAGVVTTLLGAVAATPESWPPDVEQEPYLQRAVELAAEVAAAAVLIHGLTTTRAVRAQSSRSQSRARPRQPVLLRPQALLAADDLLPDVNSAAEVASAAEAYYRVARTMAISPWEHGPPILHSLLTYGGGHSGLQTVISTYDQPGSVVISVFAARMLLEEAARLIWRYSDPTIVEDRAKQYFDEYRARQRKTINTLVSAGVPKAAAESIFSRPSNVILTPEGIASGRTPLPPISLMLRQMGAPFPEPGWLEVAYSMLSQVTHSTALGHLHTVRFNNGIWQGNALSAEMQALALDVACLGSAHLISLSAAVLADLSEESQSYRQALLQSSARVHNAARLVHGLD